MAPSRRWAVWPISDVLSGNGAGIRQNGPVSTEEGWEPIEVRVGADAEREEAGEGLADVHHLALATDPLIGPGLDLDEEVDVTLPRLARHLITLPDGPSCQSPVVAAKAPFWLPSLPPKW